MVHQTLKFTRLAGVLLAAFYLAVSAWNGFSAGYFLFKIAPFPGGLSPEEILGRAFAPVVVMCLLLLLPWRRIRSEWVWWPLFVSLAAATCIHVRGSTYSILLGLEWFMPTKPFCWPAAPFVAILLGQLAAIIWIRILQAKFL